MVDPTPDPVDQAYRDAEAVLTEQAETSARRAGVLGAVARDKAIDPVVHQTPRFISRTGWLVAASVMVVSGYLVLRFLPPQQKGSPLIVQTAAVKPTQKNERMAALSPPAPAINLSEPAPAAPKVHLSDQAPIITREQAGPSRKPVIPVAPPPPAATITPPPATAAETVTVTGTTIRPPPAIAAAPPPAVPPAIVAAAPPPMAALRTTPLPLPAAPAPSTRIDRAGELVINPDSDQLRAAAAAGRIVEVQQLLDRHIPVDVTDANGETALMKSVRADQPTMAALLIRHGASLDKKNNEGLSARDIASQINDPALKRALGIEP